MPAPASGPVSNRVTRYCAAPRFAQSCVWCMRSAVFRTRSASRGRCRVRVPSLPSSSARAPLASVPGRRHRGLVELKRRSAQDEGRVVRARELVGDAAAREGHGTRARSQDGGAITCPLRGRAARSRRRARRFDDARPSASGRVGEGFVVPQEVLRTWPRENRRDSRTRSGPR
jgi:hypothetical protein